MSNDFLPFAVDGAANVATQSAYVADGTYVDGFQTGLANSKIFNKALRQASAIASCIAQYMANTLGVSIADDGNMTTLLGHISAAFGNLPGTTPHSVPYQSAAGVTSYSTAPTTAGQCLVWNGAAWVPGSGNGDVVNWDTPAAGSGYVLGGNGINWQWVTVNVIAAGNGPMTHISWPSATAFATEVIIDSIVIIDSTRTDSDPVDSLIIGAQSVTLTGAVLYAGQNGGGTRNVTLIVKAFGK